jgi:Mg-chelatase subunit ChlD
MSRLLKLTPLALAALALLAVPAPSAAPAVTDKDKPAAKARPKVEVVFCLDTTASMTGLIAGAKAKIWSICNQIAGGTPTPDLKVGLVAYRDKGDVYVTKVFDLTDDLDGIHGHLMGFKAEGGGDIPEHVNQALHDAVHKISWSKDKKTLKIIFLVGDAPPHMDYTDDVKYPETCKKAVGKDVIINTIQCGKHAECTRIWKDIALKSEGAYAAIEQGGGVAKAVDTPYDKRLAEINREQANLTLTYGTVRQQTAAKDKAKKAAALKDAEAADRAAYFGKGDRGMSDDLAEALRLKKVKLEDLKESELPPELRKLKTTKEREEYVKKVAEKRAGLNKEAVDLDKKRNEHIQNEAKKQGKKSQDGFDESVLQMLRKQAAKQQIKY